jgi:8-amino-7-oxononanoate synthase
MIRTSYMATHTREHLERALDAFRKVGREMWLID